tara:strand:+ start:817 stop:1143 length:327 start_codon:yes stop_codon:yes gene_type:complete
LGTHAQIGVRHPDGSIDGTFVHWDGYPDYMIGALKLYIENFTTSGLTLLIIRAQKCGGISAMSLNPEFLTGGNDDARITSDTWRDNWFGACYTYLVDYKTGEVEYNEK